MAGGVQERLNEGAEQQNGSNNEDSNTKSSACSARQRPIGPVGACRRKSTTVASVARGVAGPLLPRVQTLISGLGTWLLRHWQLFSYLHHNRVLVGRRPG